MLIQLTCFARVEPDGTLSGPAPLCLLLARGFSVALAWPILASFALKPVQPENMGGVNAHGATLDQMELEADG